MLNQELVQAIGISAYQERQNVISSILEKHIRESPYTDVSIRDIINLLQLQGLKRVEAIENCMILCEDVFNISITEGLYLMIQLYIATINDYVHHIWDAIELYLFENPKKSSIDYLNYLNREEQDLSIKSIYENWIVNLEAELKAM